MLNKVEDKAWQRYRDAINSVIKMVNKTIKCDWKLNEYVDNFHIALSLIEVIELLEFEMIYFPRITKDRLIIDEFNKYIYWNYDPKVLFAHQAKRSIADIYQKLREKDDYYRNIYKLLMIHNEKEWNLYKQSDMTVAAKNTKKVYRARKKAEKLLDK